jgi:hypothetical protein
MKLNIKTEDVSIELEFDPEEFTQIMAMKTACIEHPELYKQYLVNIGTFLKFITKEMKNAEEHR